ncbi:MAG: bifunctional glutamate N-acetyltransferase/amino-acid acetyltransferase ArgJ [Yaniella sp.]|uniref:bifunctional glutamate N-acetyltransferase/amino-acid acetyltransferase ArgJ n=1 Tax=Yaniella sp. TaxID=2773929 RepID=UPI00264A388F|nr:bifunctional glutamate N-acetyltransferase/amino-acid acetyltransferase ArgJ [Yaniella sp.]MDN5730321.1 bifunctional glutamate N-acetyltransferase/amino-acid acetyltransferase ArgJ [Yaniella sp.]MDN5814316.1 bifunctional glutamate N-acetyltransferase/amino-acid acetyltransferase ArgJ [Yaniella sp.]MDN5816801.1 bifunctional glutamate N-acetyltransferase/amino-acid acetyltransferase ArgJ [Yaniella sp.]MDN5837391.1 bifunctional glutamate N-acetyltransferase/amino-acid acetyltransferase ArgJ [Ya
MSITQPAGFSASGVAAGIKDSGGLDVALVVNNGPRFDAAGVFTTNRISAAPVRWSQAAIENGQARAVVLNSGGANACTGTPGDEDAAAMAAQTAAALELSADDVLICSTGLIGERLPMDSMASGIQLAAEALSIDGSENAAKAIMTTDTVHKVALAKGSGYSVGGMTKGAGMIAPGMATMLAVVTTDAVVDATIAQQLLSEAVRTTFNRADSDGCMSTNDTVILLASGASGTSPDTAELQERIREVCASLARQIIGDAEGSTRDIAVTVHGAATEQEGEDVARTVTRSNLFKTAMFGKDPNWGRIISAVGTTDAAFDPTTIDVAVNDVMVCRNAGIGEDRNLVNFDNREVTVDIYLKAGEHDVTVWTNDLSYDYIRENAEYSS